MTFATDHYHRSPSTYFFLNHKNKRTSTSFLDLVFFFLSWYYIQMEVICLECSRSWSILFSFQEKKSVKMHRKTHLSCRKRFNEKLNAFLMGASWELWMVHACQSERCQTRTGAVFKSSYACKGSWDVVEVGTQNILPPAQVLPRYTKNVCELLPVTSVQKIPVSEQDYKNCSTLF